MTVKILFVVVVSRFLKSLPKKNRIPVLETTTDGAEGEGGRSSIFFLRILMTIKMLVTFRDSFGDLV